MRVLVVEDDAVIGALLQEGLEDAGYDVVRVAEGTVAARLASEEVFHAIVLDVLLPGMNGIDVCRLLRDRRIATPILMLTALDDVENRVRGLDVGADDYLPKPFDFRELLARLRSLLRRESRQKGRTIRVADLEIDTAEHRATRAGHALPLSHREFALLAALAAHERQVFTREALLQRVWGSETPVSNVVDVTIKTLRRKVDDGHAVRLIHTVWGVGYTLRTDP